MDTFSSAGAKISWVLLSLMALLVAVDVLGRGFFDRPTYVADELSGYLLVGITVLTLGQTEKLGKHIKAELLISRLSPMMRNWLEVVASVISLAFVIWLTWTTAAVTVQTYTMRDISQTFLRTPLWIPYLVLPVGLGVLALQLLVKIINQIRSWQATQDVLNKVINEKG